MGRQNMKWLVVVCLGAVLVLIGLFLYQKWSTETRMREITDFTGKQTKTEKKYVENEVVCSVDSEEAAKETADKVDGTLKSYQDGIAVIGIGQDVETFLRESKNREDLPAMYPNYIYSTN